MVKLFRAMRPLRAATVAVFLLGAGVFGVLATNTAIAKTKFSISVEPVLEVSIPNPDIVLQAAPDDVTYTADLDVDIVSNNQTGYTIGIAVKSNDGSARNTTDSENSLRSSAFYFYTNKYDHTDYHNLYITSSWGAYPSDGASHSTNSDGGFTQTNPEFFNSYKSTTAPTSGTTETITFGARANHNLASGVYRAEMVITVVANYIPKTIHTIKYMQEIDSDVMESMQTDEQYQLRDQRDNKYYWVAKMKDGHVWMTQNLDLEIPESGITLTPDDSDVHEDRVLSKSDESIYKSSGQYYFENGRTKKALVTEHGDQNQHYAAGGQYSWLTATVGSTGELIVNNRATESICPKGWSLPVNSSATSDYQILANRSYPYLLSKYDSKNFLEGPFYGVLGGYLNNGALVNEGVMGNLLLSSTFHTANINGTPDANGQYLTERQSNASTSAIGNVRCVTDLPHTLRFVNDAYTHFDDMPEDIILDEYEHKYCTDDTWYCAGTIHVSSLIPGVYSYRDGDYIYTFSGWDRFVTLDPSDDVNISTSTCSGSYEIGENQYNSYSGQCILYLPSNDLEYESDMLLVAKYRSEYSPE